MRGQRTEGCAFLGVSVRHERPSGAPSRGRRPLVVASTGGLKAKGKRHLARDVAVKRILGEGSFGRVFEGSISSATGTERVVLKRTKPQIPGSEEMSEMEHVLNVYASKVCRNSVAEFLGYCGVSPEEATGQLTPGNWLVWRYQGDKTLATYMRRRDTLPALAEELGVGESDVARVVLKQILLNLKGLHGAGLVHRDVKPSNLIFSAEEKAFKFIDLGACADLRLGTNYVPEESILDAMYCPPEQYVLPTDAPQLSSNAFSMVISPMLWSRHKPDRFDVYSAGLIFFQLAVPTLCSDRALKSFTASFQRYGYNLQRWREGSTLLSRHTQILDANDGQGWDLLEQMLRPRSIQKGDDGTVSFVDDGEESLRISVEAALGHPFFKAASPEQRPLVGLWRKYSRKLFELEGKILNQVLETEQQTTTVKKLKTQVAKGEASEQELQKEEKKLSLLQSSLKSMQSEFVSLAKMAFAKFGAKKRLDQETPSEEMLQSVEEEGKSETLSVGGQDRSMFGWLKGKGDGTSPAAVLGRPENLVYMGLKFTGLAAKVAGDLAKSVKADAEKLMSEIETENNQKRRREQGDRNFLELLKQTEVTEKMSYAQASKQLQSAEAFGDVTADRRELLFAAYVRALKEKRAKAEQNAEGRLRRLYMEEGVGSGTKWETLSTKLKQNAIYLAVQDPSARRQIFDDLLAEAEARAASAAAAEADESRFRVLLREMQPPIRWTSSWPRIKQQLYDDPRYQAVKERRRREIFLEYRAIVGEIEKEESERERLTELQTLKSKAASDTAEAEARLAELMSQRSKLKEQYDKMQANLKRMEETLDSQKQRIQEKEAKTQSSTDGTLTFKFDDETPR